MVAGQDLNLRPSGYEAHNLTVSKRTSISIWRWLAIFAYECTTPIDFKAANFTLTIRTDFLRKNIEILAIFAFGSIRASLCYNRVMFYSKREESLCVIPNTVKCLPINILAERFWVHCLPPQNFCPIDVSNTSHNGLVHDQASN